MDFIVSQKRHKMAQKCHKMSQNGTKMAQNVTISPTQERVESLFLLRPVYKWPHLLGVGVRGFATTINSIVKD